MNEHVRSLSEEDYPALVDDGAAPLRERIELERELGQLIRGLTAVSTQLGHEFAGRHDLREPDMRALMLVYMADVEGRPLSTTQLAHALGLTSAGGTYLVERLVTSGHVRREAHPTDRRKILLRYADAGLAVAQDFFGPLFQANHRALTHHDDDALRTALAVLRDIITSMDGYRSALRDG
ncbi:MarR family winged helix-turn-helix transcriptional regulator [Granulicoccus sp. GXG6511]|uniref:MarR family winged helix-turn-helix transcriptional regulator n=1 Tax=Granulicoccus sp. GXG6511 TaxID=3381351 RepID=UPI003D7D51CF